METGVIRSVIKWINDDIYTELKKKLITIFFGEALCCKFLRSPS